MKDRHTKDLDKLKALINQIKISQRSQHITIRKVFEELVNILESLDLPKTWHTEDTGQAMKTPIEKAEEIRKRFEAKEEK